MRKILVILLSLVVVAFLVGITSNYATAKKGGKKRIVQLFKMVPC